MSNLIPPLLSSSPPPIVGPLDEDDDDEFGDFRAAADSYGCDDLSLPASPQKELTKVNLDINCNNSQKSEMPTENLNGSIFMKDFQDRRKSLEQPIEVNCSSSETEQIVHKESNSESDQTNKNEVLSSIDYVDQKVEETISNSLENDENIFDAFSESVQEKTSDELSELNEINEIKSENDFTEEIQDEIICENLKEDESESQSISLKVCETDDDFGDFANFDSEKPEFEFDDFVESQKIDSEFDDFVEPQKLDNEFDDFVEPQKPDLVFDIVESQKLDFEFDDCIEPQKLDFEIGDFVERQKADSEFDNFVEPSLVPEPVEDDFGDFESSDFADFTSHSSEQPKFLLEINEKNAIEKSEIILNEIFPKIAAEFDDFNLIDDTKNNRIFEELKDVTETNALIYQWSKSNSQKMFFKALNIDTRNILYGPSWNGSMPRFAANLGLAPLEPIKPEILTPISVQQTSSPSISSQKNSSDIPTAQFDWSGSGLINPLDSAAPNERPGTVPEDSQSQVRTNFSPASSAKLESIPTLFDSEKLETEPIEIPKVTEQSDFSSPKFIPLRETHIATDLNDLNKPGWLQPTILTPDLPRKETVLEPDDEFDDFQMVLPEEKPKIPLTLDLSEFGIQKIEKPVHNHEHIFEIPSTSGPIKPPIQTNDDDEFTEFHSSLPPETLKPLQPIPLEPLKPTLQYSAPVAQINWPEPGVSDEDIKNIELSYSRKSDETPKNDDDEWTDFVSVTSPIKTERTATPDLPLSVLNLNSVQAPKQPIPVITPNGLVQTKLSSNLKSVVQTSVQPNLYRPPTTLIQPSLISSQFAANFFSSAPSMKPQMTITPSTASQDDDDDWSDFVSGQPPPQVNGYQKNVKPVNWANATTNIIMNPTHFDSFQSYATSQKKTQQIPSISAIPDLDFIAPKNRTSKK